MWAVLGSVGVRVSFVWAVWGSVRVGCSGFRPLVLGFPWRGLFGVPFVWAVLGSVG